MQAGDFHHVRSWFTKKGWGPFDFQLQAWRAQAAGRSGLIHSDTGTGKTLAACLGVLDRAKQRLVDGQSEDESHRLRVLWITPLRALAVDTGKSLQEACAGVGLDWRVELRTGDTAWAAKKRQREKPPEVLVTTPESVCVLLSYPDSSALLRGVELIVVDEWHELMGSKRGVQTELALARVRTLSPKVVTWGVSATMGNTKQAMEVLLGAKDAEQGVLITGIKGKRYDVRTMIPKQMERFPWAGHLGLRQLDGVLEAIDAARSTLVFCNTRGQAELWYQTMLKARPEWIAGIDVEVSEDDGDGGGGAESEGGEENARTKREEVRSAPIPLALHHGSLDRALRLRIEELLKAGRVRAVVCTSSLDLGVDFPPVDQVIQIGSPKGVARLLQRAGRAGHAPGQVSRIVCVPTNALEIIEFASARDAIEQGRIESREPMTLSLDVLCQHMLTLACGEGFSEGELIREVRSTHAFAELTDQQWSWALSFAFGGGPALGAYDRFARLGRNEHGRVIAVSDTVRRFHRPAIGTIVSEQAIAVKYQNGGMLGTVEEGFIGSLTPGSVFVFAGRRLELISLREMVATVRPARRRTARVVTWPGGRMALSTELAQSVQSRLGEAERGELRGEELRAVANLLALQRSWSTLPCPSRLVIELVTTVEGWHAFVYPLQGRLVHEGLANLLAHRLAQAEPRTIAMAVNDYGFELVSTTPLPTDAESWRALLRTDGLEEALTACINAGGLAKRQFREIARIAGLISTGFPSRSGRRSGPSSRHLQASSELFFDVFQQFDPSNLLLDQARREVLGKQLQFTRLRAALKVMQDSELRLTNPGRLTPMSFGLWADRLREQLTSERWHDRVERMLANLERDATSNAPPVPETPVPASSEIIDVGGSVLRSDGSAPVIRRRRGVRRRPRL